MLANSGQLWFYHAPSKHPEKPQQLVPPASQVPGLAALDPLDQEAWMREVGIKTQKQALESDSKYIRLAKQGGRKNLLMFNAPTGISEEPQPYPRVDWFHHQERDAENDKKILSNSAWQPPEYMVHEYENPPVEEHSEEPAQMARPKRAPFYTDNMSVWRRTDEENKPKRTMRRRNPKKADKLPQLPVRQAKADPVAFSKLIGGEYGTEWYKNQAVRGPVKTKYADVKPGKGYLNMTEYQESICRKVIPPKKLKPITLNPMKKQQVPKNSENKDVFKLSKFNKVESKLKTDAN